MKKTIQDLISALMQIAHAVQQIAMAMTPASEISKPISEYLTFDWSSIGAVVLRSDEDGPSLVECQGQVWKRRAPDNQFGTCIWFSRCIGKDGEGRNKYQSLISFSEIKDDAEPLGRKAKKAVEASRESRPPAPERKLQQKPASAETVAELASRLTSQQTEYSGDHRAKTVADLVTPKQLRTIRLLTDEASLDAGQKCQSLFGCNLEELSKRSASRFIEHLAREQEERALPAPAAAEAPTTPQSNQAPTDDDLAPAEYQEHRQVEAEMKAVYLACGKTQSEWDDFYAEKNIYDLSLPVKREKLAGMKKHAEGRGIRLVPPAPAGVSPDQAAIKDLIARIEGHGVSRDGDKGWAARMARIAAGICEVEHLDPDQAAKVRASFKSWEAELATGLKLTGNRKSAA